MKLNRINHVCDIFKIPLEDNNFLSLKQTFIALEFTFDSNFLSRFFWQPVQLFSIEVLFLGHLIVGHIHRPTRKENCFGTAHNFLKPNN